MEKNKKLKNKYLRLNIVLQIKKLLIAHSSLLIVILISCQTAPQQFDVLLQETHIPLDTGANIYILANIEQARPIIDILPIQELKNDQTIELLDKTDFIAAALFPYVSGINFQLAAWGNYPSTGASIALGSNRSWERITAENREIYWYAQSSQLSIAMEAKRAFALSFHNSNYHKNPRAEPPGVEIPDGFEEFSRSSPLSLWINNAGAMISGLLRSAGIPLQLPVQEMFLNFYTMPEGDYELSVRMLFANATQARGAVSMINVASGFAQNSLSSIANPGMRSLLSVFLSKPPVQNGSNIDFESARLSESDLKALFELLMNNAF